MPWEASGPCARGAQWSAMRMIPEKISPTTKSNAEKEIFRRLELIDDTDWSFVLHSLNLAEHVWKRVGEIDFLVAGPRGIYVLEVKGGGVSSERGVWRFTDRFGHTRRKRESPFSQARTAMFSLQKRLEGSFQPGLLSRATFGYAVVFPDCDFDAESVEWAPEMVIDRRQLERKDGIRRSLGRLASYWRAKPGSRNGLLGSTDLHEVLRVLRPDFDVIPSLQHVAMHADAELARLTANQYRALDAHARNPRIVFEGGAGTGKTLLAAEICRRERDSGSRTLFTCRSGIIAGFVASQPEMNDVDVLPFGRIPAAEIDRFDAVIVDEAQDLLNFNDLAVLDRILADGLEDGRWSILLDSNNQRGLVGSYDEDAMNYLRSFRPVDLILNDNCRNTRQIVSETQVMTGADVGVSAAGTGPDVEVVFGETPQRRTAAVDRHLEALIRAGVEPTDIVLLSPLEFHESAFGRLPARWRQRIDILDLKGLQQRPRSRLGFARTADFKGLESRFVLLADIGMKGQKPDLPALYVGMTRARIGLWVVLDERLRGILSTAVQ
jgi:hypothetical protein